MLNHSNSLKNVKGKSDCEVEFNTVKIGDQEWMTDNLCVDTYRNGDPIPYAQTEEEADEYGLRKEGCYCFYFEKNYKSSDKEYNWYAVNDPRGLAPEGYRVSSNNDWTQLFDTLGGLDEVETITNSLCYSYGFNLRCLEQSHIDHGWFDSFWASDNLDDGEDENEASQVWIWNDKIGYLPNTDLTTVGKDMMRLVRCIRDVETIDDFFQGKSEKDIVPENSFDDFM